MLTIFRTLTARLSAALVGDDVWGESSTQARLEGGPADTLTLTTPGASPLATVETTARRGSFVVADTRDAGWGFDGIYDTRAEAERAADILPHRDVFTWTEFAREAASSSELVQVVAGGRVRALDI